LELVLIERQPCRVQLGHLAGTVAFWSFFTDRDALGAPATSISEETMNQGLQRDTLHRPIACATCDPKDEPTLLQAWVEQSALARAGAASIDDIDDEEIRHYARTYGDAGIEGHCMDCNGA
jgi:hypothetical protein